ncbi:MAG: restriction endonuclease subunit S [Lachnospiraceae bacterium]|nr:restriction endonuclease subunit S [Lachnospiraceae bacterium]
MTEEIKARAAQIQEGEVPEGYQRTPAGVIPLDWDVAKLGDVVKKIEETAGSREYETLSISAGIGFVNQAKKFGRELSGAQYSRYTVLHRGDFSYNKGNSSLYPQGCIYRLKDRETAAVPNVFESFRFESLNGEYYDQLFTAGYLNRQLFPKINHGVRDNGLLNLTGQDFYSCYIPIPPLAEQQKIAEILAQCDTLMKYKRDKIAEIKNLKVAYLDKMFPKKNCNVPEIRFPGFADVWEQRKVTELGEIYIGLVTTMTAHYTDHGTLLIRNSDIKDGKFEFDTDPIYLDDEFAEANKSRMHKVGDVITVHTGDVGTSAVITENEANSIGFATIVTRPNKEILDSYYLSTFLNTNKHKNWAVQMSTGDGRTNYNLREYTELIVPVPSISEQKKIAKYIIALNTLIALHQRELEETQNYKKALMQLLLTGLVRVGQ